MPFFLVKADELYNVADTGEAGGALEILDGGTKRPVLVTSIKQFGAKPRVLTLASALEPDRPCASSTPCMMVSMEEEICHKIELRGNFDSAAGRTVEDGRIWGTMLPLSSDTYGVFFQGQKEPLIMLEGDQENGRLTAKVGGEVVAHATRDSDGDHLEIGVNPHVDPILMLMCILAVVIFNPEEPEPLGAS